MDDGGFSCEADTEEIKPVTSLLEGFSRGLLQSHEFRSKHLKEYPEAQSAACSVADPGLRSGLGWTCTFESHQEISPTSIYTTKRKYRLRKEASLALRLENFNI